MCPLWFQVQLDKDRDSHNHVRIHHLRVEFLLKTDSGYLKDNRDILFTLATPGNPLRYHPPVSSTSLRLFRGTWEGVPVTSLAHSNKETRIDRPKSVWEEVPVTSLTYSNIETLIDRPKSVVRVIRGVA